MTRKTFKTLLLITLSLLMAFLPAGAFASTSVGVKVNGGPLDFNLPAPAQLAEVNLTGFDQIVGGNLGLIDVADARGTGDGWNLVIKADDFLNTDGSGNLIPAAGFSIDPTPTVIKIAGNTPPPEAFFGPLDQPLTLLVAPQDTGMGRFQTDPNVSLLVPAGTLAGTYESTVTVTIASGL